MGVLQPQADEVHINGHTYIIFPAFSFKISFEQCQGQGITMKNAGATSIPSEIHPYK
jgi:hypothetical protein